MTMLALALALCLPQEPSLGPTFARQTLSTKFLCEGAGSGDLDGDGDADVAAGPWWYEGPQFTTRHALYAEKAFHPLRYSDNFFAWIRDLDGDGDNDIFNVGFPGTPAWWLENQGNDAWPRHVVCEVVDNESPWFGTLLADGKPALVCQQDDCLGYVAPGADPRQPWSFHRAFGPGAGPKFTHGLGVGDVNGDGRLDLLHRLGWLEQPASLASDAAWTMHAYNFSTQYGGAQMLVCDVDGDGRNDVISSDAAHHYGLRWHQQQADGAFVAHEILPANRTANNVSELHALCLADLDGDGLRDVVTGKRWWSHGPSKANNSDGLDDAARLLGLLLRRDAQGAHFEVVTLDAETGVGVQVQASDVNGDARCDVVVSNKRGTFVLRQVPPGTAATQEPVTTQPDLTFESGTLRGWILQGDAFLSQPTAGDTVAARRKDMHSGHRGQYWIGGYEHLGDDALGTMTSVPFAVQQPWATYWVGGGGSNKTRVEVLGDDDAVLSSAHGDEDEQLRMVVVDLRQQLGRRIRVRLIDEAKGHWGHLNFDEFVFHAEQPAGAAPDQVTGKTPEQAAQAMTTPPGFHVELVAGEPQLHQPIALWVDERSRLWVAEAFSYPHHVGAAKARDSLVVFEDRDQNGSYEARTTFYEGFDLISGFLVGHGGVWVGAAPNLYFVPDHNRDLVPDGPPEIVLDGFGFQDTHETLNSFVWGPDGWMYGTHGVFTHSRVGPPGCSDAQRVPFNAGVWRMHPKTRQFEGFAWGTSNPWGVDFDDRGQAFIACCVIDHLWHMIPGSRSERQGGTHFDAYPWLQLGTIADHRHFVGKTSDHAWWNGRNRPVADAGIDAAGGGHAHCGMLLYKGDAFPPEYRNAALFANIHGNRINHDVLQRDGSGYRGTHGADLVRANDPWFRGVALRLGANGEVFFIDWYDKNACHRTAPEIWDRTNGRLYRLRYGENANFATLALDQLDDVALALLCVADNDFVGAHARRLLAERRDVDVEALAKLRQGLRDSSELRSLRCLWALHQCEALQAQDLQWALAQRSEDLRGWAVRLACEQPERFPAVVTHLAQVAARESSPSVRLELASALQRLADAPRWTLAHALVQHPEDASDRNLPTLLWYGVEALAERDPERFLLLAQATQIPTLRRLLWRRAAVTNEAARAQLLRVLVSAPALQLEILDAFVAAQKDRPELPAPAGWQQVAAQWLTQADPALREAASSAAVAFGDLSLAKLLRERVQDPSVPLTKRQRALELLLRQPDAATGQLLITLLADAALRRAALAGLAHYDLPVATQRILERLEALDPTDREIALNTLAAREASALALLTSMREERVSVRLLDAASLRRQLHALHSPAVDDLLQRAWGRSVAPSESAAAELARHKALLTPQFRSTADAAAGRAIFMRTCQACHKLFDQGGVLGPDLTGSNRQDLDYLLANLVDPSAEVGRDYQLVTLHLRDGRTLIGNLARETKATLTLRTLAGEQVLRREELAADLPQQPAMAFSNQSLMPPGQLLALRPEEIRDLLAYLMSPTQTPVLGSSENVAWFFDGSLANWRADPAVWSVEDDELVGRTTTGLAHNNFAMSELLLDHFRLTFEVKLSPDTANSGVQFRSEPLPDGEMRGYQADIGKGWWGLLYEEGGRGVLQKPTAAAERPGEWNQYEVLAQGAMVQLTLNGTRTVRLLDPDGRKRGVIALQVHSGGPTEVRFRNFHLELLPSAPIAPR